MTTPYYIPETDVPLPPKNADVITTACDYCIVACGYKVYRWPVAGNRNGGPAADGNAFGAKFPVDPLGPWVAPNQHNIVLHKGQPYHVVIIPDKDTEFVNPNGDSSLRGGCIAQKCYNPQTPTRDRLKSPMMRIYGILQPVPWDFALDVAAEVAKHVIAKHGDNAYGVKTYSYQYIENTYAITKYALRHIATANFTFHDTPSDVSSTPGFRDAGFDNFGPSYEDWMNAETLLIAGTDPYETKTILWTQWIMRGIQNGQKTIFLNPRRTAGVAYAEKNGGLWLDVTPGTDLLVLNAIARIIVENGWQDADWIKRWVNNKWGSSSGFGQGTRNTPWQWRTTWGKFQVKGFDDWRKWILAQEESKPEVAAKIAGIDVEKIYKAAEMMAKPKANGERVKTTICLEKGNYWSNNYLNTASIGTLGVILGCGGRPGQVITRLGGHQRGGVNGGPYPTTKSPYKVPGRRRHRLDLDRWLTDGHVRFAYVVGTTWIQSMPASSDLEDAFKRLTKLNENQVRSFDKQEIIDTLKRRADSGGTVVVNQDIYLRNPIGNQYADIVLPAATWGEEDFARANGERRVRLYSKFYDPPGNALPDWKIVAMIAQKMGFEGYDWRDSNEVFEESCRFTRGSRKDYNVIRTVAKRKGMKAHDFLRTFGTHGLQAPLMLDGDKIIETKRLHDYNRTDLPETGPEGVSVMGKQIMAFKSHTGKLNLVKSPWGLWSDFYDFMQPKGDELWITNGRINEIWESGFDDYERRPYTQQRWPMNFVEIHPDDAAARGIESGDLVAVGSTRVPVQKDFNLGVKGDDMWFSGLMKRGHIELVSGQFSAVAMVTPAIKKGVLFTDFLKMDAPANSVTPRVPDPITQNYRFKIASGTVKKFGESPYKHKFDQMTFKRRDIV